MTKPKPKYEIGDRFIMSGLRVEIAQIYQTPDNDITYLIKSTAIDNKLQRFVFRSRQYKSTDEHR